MIVIIDYGMGNLQSVANAACFLGKQVVVTDARRSIEKAKKIVFPGVGNFSKAVKELKQRKIFELLKEKIAAGTPFLGICLGMQLLFERSEEAKGVKGLAVIKGVVKRFAMKDLIVPHMGWNKIKLQVDHRNLIIKGDAAEPKANGTASPRPQAGIFKAVKDGSYFYFAHSYYCVPDDKKTILTTTTYGVTFASSVRKDNVCGVQFHPEKSQRLGLKVFNNFLSL